MTESEAKKYMLIEKECINRDCDRDCANCDIVQNVEDLNNAYDVAINALEARIAKKVKIEQWIDTKCDCGYEFSKHRGDGYYSIPLENKTKYCPNCGQKLDWNE